MLRLALTVVAGVVLALGVASAGADEMDEALLKRIIRGDLELKPMSNDQLSVEISVGRRGDFGEEVFGASVERAQRRPDLAPTSRRSAEGTLSEATWCQIHRRST